MPNVADARVVLQSWDGKDDIEAFSPIIESCLDLVARVMFKKWRKGVILVKRRSIRELSNFSLEDDSLEYMKY